VNPGVDLRFEGPGAVLRRRVSLLMGALVCLTVSMVLRGLEGPGWGVAVEQGLTVWLLISFSHNRYRATRKGLVRASTEGLRLGSKTVVERSRIAAAFLLSSEDSIVRIVRRRALSLDVRLESEEKARAMLTALGLGIGQSMATFSAWYGGRRRSLAVVAAAVAGAGALGASSALLHDGGMAAAGRLLLVAAVALSFYLRSFARVDVGSDGVLLRRLGDSRFVSYASIARASVDERDAIVLALRSGRDIRLSMGSSPDKAPLRDALVHRIEEGRIAFARHAGTEGAEALVAPGGRKLGPWMKDVRALTGPLDYRETRLDEERLWRVVDDATAAPATRAGAALAISALDQPPSRLRLRVAAEACAEPKLRVALTRVAEGASDPDLEEALAPLLESGASPLG
jgi:acyl-coenzyme A thioesterase PaaI-like protein